MYKALLAKKALKGGESGDSPNDTVTSDPGDDSNSVHQSSVSVGGGDESQNNPDSSCDVSDAGNNADNPSFNDNSANVDRAVGGDNARKPPFSDGQETAPGGQNRPPICKHYQLGRCTFVNCRFLHGNPAIPGGASSSGSQEAASTDADDDAGDSNSGAVPKKNICFNFLKGACFMGARCFYRHVRPVNPMTNTKRICFSYINGKCFVGNCSFEHIEVVDASESNAEREMPMQQPQHRSPMVPAQGSMEVGPPVSGPAPVGGSRPAPENAPFSSGPSANIGPGQRPNAPFTEAGQAHKAPPPGMSQPPGPQNKVKVCFAFQEGRCKWAQCKFAHIMPDQAQPVAPNNAPVCVDFLNGECWRRDCRFSHDRSNLNDSPSMDEGQRGFGFNQGQQHQGHGRGFDGGGGPMDRRPGGPPFGQAGGGPPFPPEGPGSFGGRPGGNGNVGGMSRPPFHPMQGGPPPVPGQGRGPFSPAPGDGGNNNSFSSAPPDDYSASSSQNFNAPPPMIGRGMARPAEDRGDQADRQFPSNDPRPDVSNPPPPFLSDRTGSQPGSHGPPGNKDWNQLSDDPPAASDDGRLVWTCGNARCGFRANRGEDSRCWECNAARPPAELAREKSPDTSKPDDDWLCPRDNCRNSNYHWRRVCNKCRTPKPRGADRKEERKGSRADGSEETSRKRSRSPSDSESRQKARRVHDDDRRESGDRRQSEQERRPLSPTAVITSSTKACFDFQKGRCPRGQYCKYEHVYKREVCRRFLQNRCHNKDCVYDHVTEGEMEGNVNVNYADVEDEEGESPGKDKLNSSQSEGKEEKSRSTDTRKSQEPSTAPERPAPPAEDDLLDDISDQEESTPTAITSSVHQQRPSSSSGGGGYAAMRGSPSPMRRMRVAPPREDWREERGGGGPLGASADRRRIAPPPYEDIPSDWRRGDEDIEEGEYMEVRKEGGPDPQEEDIPPRWRSRELEGWRREDMEDYEEWRRSRTRESSLRREQEDLAYRAEMEDELIAYKRRRDRMRLEEEWSSSKRRRDLVEEELYMRRRPFEKERYAEPPLGSRREVSPETERWMRRRRARLDDSDDDFSPSKKKFGGVSLAEMTMADWRRLKDQEAKQEERRQRQKELQELETASARKKALRRSTRYSDSDKSDEELDSGRYSATKIQAMVTEATTPLANLSYHEQITKKKTEVEILVKHLEEEMSDSNAGIAKWIKDQYKREGVWCKIEKIKESPVLEGYRNKCEFTIGFYPDTGRLTVGFKLDPRSPSSDVGPIHHLKHVPTVMKNVVQYLEMFLRSTAPSFPPFNPDKGEGGWYSAVVRVTQNSEVMLIVNFVPLDVSLSQLRSLKEKMQQYFESGNGVSANITSLYFCEKMPGSSGTLELLHGTEHIVESVFGLEFIISPRAYFCINTYGAELLFDTILQVLGVTSQTTILDICCGTGSIGLSLSKWCSQVLGVDVSPEAIVDAKKNASMNRIHNTTYRVGPAEDMIEDLVQHATYDISAILDPPRSGVPGKLIRVIRGIPRITKLLYVASDPKSVMKNLLDLTLPTSAALPGDPLMPMIVSPVDLFPHTSHYFTLILFTRVNNSQLISGPSTTTTTTISTSMEKESSLSREQRDWLDQMDSMYGSVFERDKWIETFIRQNHEAAVQQTQQTMLPRPVPASAPPGLPPPVGAAHGAVPPPHQPMPPTMSPVRPPPMHLPPPPLSGSGPGGPQNFDRSVPPPLGHPPPPQVPLSSLPPPRVVGSGPPPRLGGPGPPPPSLRPPRPPMSPPPQLKVSGLPPGAAPPRIPPPSASSSSPMSGDIPPMPEFPVPPKSSDPVAYQEYKQKYADYTAWYDKYGKIYKGPVGISTSIGAGSALNNLPDPNQVPRGTNPEAWRKYCRDTREYWEKLTSSAQLRSRPNPS